MKKKKTAELNKEKELKQSEQEQSKTAESSETTDTEESVEKTETVEKAESADTDESTEGSETAESKVKQPEKKEQIDLLEPEDSVWARVLMAILILCGFLFVIAVTLTRLTDIPLGAGSVTAMNVQVSGNRAEFDVINMNSGVCLGNYKYEVDDGFLDISFSGTLFESANKLPDEHVSVVSDESFDAVRIVSDPRCTNQQSRVIWDSNTIQ